MEKFLIEHETTFDEGHDVLLLNTNEAGTICLTNFRLIFVSKSTKCIVELGTIPLTAVHEINDVMTKALKRTLHPEQSMFQVTGHDMRVLRFSFKSENMRLKEMITNLKKCIKPGHLGQICAFSFKPRVEEVSSPSARLLKEYHRLFQKWFARSPCTQFDAEAVLRNKWWRISEVNSDYQLCESYPTRLIVPNRISDNQLCAASTYRKKNRLPAISWFDPGSGAVLARSSQPTSSFLGKMEQLVCDLRTPDIHAYQERKLYIVDARPVLNACANTSTGGGTEFYSNFPHTVVCYSAIDNIHAMTKSFGGLREYLNDYGSISSNGAPLDQRNPISSWLTLTKTPESVTDILKLQRWLRHIQIILAGALYITAKITGESASVLVHCSDGWDRTSQLVGLSCLLLDPYYRTFSGFQALVEKDWLAFGHKFAARMGLPTGKTRPEYMLPWLANDSTKAASWLPWLANDSTKAASWLSWLANDSTQAGERSPIFLQWLECIAHLLSMYPCAFEFSSKFLVDLMDAILSCRFGNFLCNSEREREQAGVTSCPCIWKYLADLRASGTLHEHRNPFYDPEKHNGPIVPPAPALAPTLWPQFYLRWSCPSESHGGVGGCQELVKAKMEAEPLRDPESPTADEHQPVTGRPIRVVGSNVKKR